MSNSLILRENDFKSICEIIKSKSGINLSEKKRNLVFTRLIPRLRELKIKKFTHYVKLLKDNTKELEVAINLITTNVTHFFRENHQYEFMKEVLIPEVIRERAKQLQIWSGACSTGEEPYSLAITMLESIKFSNIDWHIIATDINTHVLGRAREGIYPKKAIASLDKKIAKKYFHDIDDHSVAVKNFVKEYLSFKQYNLMEKNGPNFYRNLDVIFCRNVFIYFSKDTQIQVLKKFSRLLKPNRYLFLGHAEFIDIQTQKNQGWSHLGKGIYKILPG